MNRKRTTIKPSGKALAKKRAGKKVLAKKLAGRKSLARKSVLRLVGNHTQTTLLG
jgi:hypothetical protein